MSTELSEAKSPSREWVLQPESEYRWELDPGTSMAVKLIKGEAEIFGAELVHGKTYLFGAECKAAVFTWQGFPHVTGQPSTEYVSEETPMAPYANVHIALEQLRLRASSKDSTPEPSWGKPVSSSPRVLVLGPDNSGKTTVCKILINYAVRSGQDWAPFLINVDPNEGGWAAPGAISAACFISPIPTYSPANPLGSAASSSPTALPAHALTPLVFWYGHSEAKKNPLLMERLIRNLGGHLDDRYLKNPEAATSGLIVDTPPSFASGSVSNEQRQKLIKACVDAFHINIILVVGHEKLNVEMQRMYSNGLTVVKIPKSGGVVELDHHYQQRIHNMQFHTYMYGQTINPPPGVTQGVIGGESLTDFVLSPSSTVISFGDITIYRIGAGSMAPSSALPIGAQRVLSEMQPVLVDPGSSGAGLHNAVMGLLAPANPDENERYEGDILDLPIVAFVVITNIDIPKKKLTILSPNQVSLAGKTAIVGSFEFQEQ